MRNIVLFRVFFIFLFLFFWRTAVYWVNFEYGRTAQDVLLYVFLVITMLIGTFLINKNYKLIPSKPIHYLALAWFVLMIVVAVYNQTALSITLKSLMWPIVFEVTYIYSKINVEAEKYFRKYFFLLAIMGLFFVLGKLILVNFSAASNLVYFFILPMPFLLRTNDSRKLYLLFFVMSAMAILSGKRSMILSIAMFLLIWGFFNTVKRKKTSQSIFLLLFIVGLTIYSFQNFRLLSEGRVVKRMAAEDVTNGREAIYDVTILMIENSSIDHKILGNGHNAVRRDSPMDISSHNEWLEIIYDYGYIAIGLYICLWIIMLYNWYKLYKTKSPYFIPYSLLICVWGVMSMVSQLILYASYVLYLFMFVAFIEARQDKTIILYKKRSKF